MTASTNPDPELEAPLTFEIGPDGKEVTRQAKQLISETRTTIVESGLEGDVEQNLGDALAHITNETIAEADSDSMRTEEEQTEVSNVVVATELEAVGADLIGTENDPIETVVDAGNERDVVEGLAEIAKLDPEIAEMIARDVDIIEQKPAAHVEAEKAFNETLTKIDSLDEQVGRGVSKSIVQYEDKEVPVYDMEGAPIKLLVTNLRFRGGKSAYEDYLKGAKFKKTYTERAVSIQANPKLWTEISNPPEGTPSRGSSYISTNYIDSGKNLSKWGGEDSTRVGYGFDHLGEGDLIAMGNHDLVVGGENERTEGAYKDYDLDKLHDDIYWGSNEVAVRRRSTVDGSPKLPDAIIIAKNAEPDDLAMASKHAAFYGIPIVRIDGSKYSRE